MCIFSWKAFSLDLKCSKCFIRLILTRWWDVLYRFLQVRETSGMASQVWRWPSRGNLLWRKVLHRWFEACRTKEKDLFGLPWSHSSRRKVSKAWGSEYKHKRFNLCCNGESHWLSSLLWYSLRKTHLKVLGVLCFWSDLCIPFANVRVNCLSWLFAFFLTHVSYTCLRFCPLHRINLLQSQTQWTKHHMWPHW